jgi:hypothetical protein
VTLLNDESHEFHVPYQLSIVYLWLNPSRTRWNAVIVFDTPDGRFVPNMEIILLPDICINIKLDKKNT